MSMREAGLDPATSIENSLLHAEVFAACVWEAAACLDAAKTQPDSYPYTDELQTRLAIVAEEPAIARSINSTTKRVTCLATIAVKTSSEILAAEAIAGASAAYRGETKACAATQKARFFWRPKMLRGH